MNSRNAFAPALILSILLKSALGSEWSKVVYIGYYGSDGYCQSPKYAQVSVEEGSIVIRLSKTDECNCGCDALAWLGLSELKEGTYKVEVTYVLLKHDGPYFKLMLPLLVIINSNILRSNTPDNFVGISPASVIRGGHFRYLSTSGPKVFEWVD